MCGPEELSSLPASRWRPLWLILLLQVPAGAAQDTAPPVEGPPEAGEQRPENESFTNRLHDKTRWTFDDEKIGVKLGALLQLDFTAVDEDDELENTFGDLDNSADIRRAMVNFDALFYRWLFRFQIDAGQDPGIKDFYVQGREEYLPYVNWRLGNMKEPFSLEQQTSSKNIAFLERSLPVSAFAPGHNFGLMLHDPLFEERMTWAVGAFTNSGSRREDDQSGASDLTFTGRLTGVPLYENDGARLVHLGASYSARKPKDDLVRYSTRPEARSVTDFVDTGEISADSNALFGLELAAVRDRNWFMAEYMQSRVDNSQLGDPVFGGYYVQLGRFLTPDTKAYSTKNGTFGQELPNNPFLERPLGVFRDLGHSHERRGAWEAVGRWSHVDLDDGPVQGGTLTDLGVSLNWYPDRFRKVELNYTNADLEEGGSANILLLRLQWFF